MDATGTKNAEDRHRRKGELIFSSTGRGVSRSELPPSTLLDPSPFWGTFSLLSSPDGPFPVEAPFLRLYRDPSFPFDWDVGFQSNPKGCPFECSFGWRIRARLERFEAHEQHVHVQHDTCHVHRRRRSTSCSRGGLEGTGRILVVNNETTWLRPHRRRVDRANLLVPSMGWCSSAKPQPRPMAIRGMETRGTHLQEVDMQSDKPWEVPRRRMG